MILSNKDLFQNGQIGFVTGIILHFSCISCPIEQRKLWETVGGKKKVGVSEKTSSLLHSWHSYGSWALIGIYFHPLTAEKIDVANCKKAPADLFFPSANKTWEGRGTSSQPLCCPWWRRHRGQNHPHTHHRSYPHHHHHHPYRKHPTIFAQCKNSCKLICIRKYALSSSFSSSPLHCNVIIIMMTRWTTMSTSRPCQTTQRWCFFQDLPPNRDGQNHDHDHDKHQYDCHYHHYRYDLPPNRNAQNHHKYQRNYHCHCHRHYRNIMNIIIMMMIIIIIINSSSSSQSDPVLRLECDQQAVSKLPPDHHYQDHHHNHY